MTNRQAFTIGTAAGLLVGAILGLAACAPDDQAPPVCEPLAVTYASTEAAQ